MIKNVAQEILMKNMNPFQIGAEKGHRAAEHIYVILIPGEALF